MNPKHSRPSGRLHPAFIALLAGAFVAALLVAAAPAIANEKALYGPEAPPGSTFVRVLNASDAPDVSASVGPESFSGISAWTITDFTFLPAGTHRIAVGGQSQDATLQANRFYTAVSDGRSLRLIDNDPYGNRLKALIVLYNLTEAGELSLRTSDGATTVVDDVAQGGFGTREVNAARARFALFAGDARVGETPPVGLKRGEAFSLFAVGSAAKPKLVWTTN